MTTTMTDLRDGRTYVFNEALPGRDAYEDALALGFEGTRAAWLATLRGFAFDPASADWEVDRPYAVNAAIRHQHKIWVAKVAHEGVTPGTDPEVWQLLLDGASALELSNAVAAALAHQGAAETAAGLAEAKRAAAAAILNATLDAAAALTPIDALHPVSLPIPAGWWDTGDRLLSGASERAIICNWAHEILAPAALWRGTLPASLRAATDGTGEAAVGATIARINDSSGNALHLTQASTSLRPIRGRRPKTGVRNRLRRTEDVSAAPWYVQGGAAVLGPDAVAFSGPAQSLYQSSALPGGASVGMVATFSAELSGTGLVYLGVSRSTGGVYEDTKVAVTLTETPTRYAASHMIASPGQVGFSGFVSTAANGTAEQVTIQRAQLELGGAATPYQAVGSAGSDITETGVESVPFAAFDLVDDALTTGAIAGGLAGQAFVAGDGGCYVSDLSVAPGGTFSIGGTSDNWTGAAPGILRAVTGGTGRVLDAIIRAGTYSEDEIARLERFCRAKGGKGLLLPAAGELIVNGAFDIGLTGWLQADPARGAMLWEAGTLKLDNSGTPASGNYAQQTLTTVSPAYYYVSAEVTACAAVIPRIFVGSLPGSSSLGIVSLASGATGTLSLVFQAPGTTAYLGVQTVGGSGAGAFANFDNVSVRRLIPREDL